MDLSQWKRILARPHLNNAVFSPVEVGYTRYGPTVIFSGTMTASNKMLFVDEVSAIISKEKDKTKHVFNWFAFQPPEFNNQGLKEINFRTPSKFLIRPEHPHKYNIIFVDHAKYSEMKPLLKAVKGLWEEMLEGSSSADYEILYAELMQEKAIIEAVDRLKEISLWRTGQYSIEMIVKAKQPKHNFKIYKSFTLTQRDVETLTQNAKIVIADLCKQLTASYYFVSLALF